MNLSVALLGPRRAAARLIRRADKARDTQDHSEAAKFYARALDLTPGRTDIRVQLGHMMKELGRYQAAEAAYRRALSRSPGDGDIHLQLGHLLKLTGRKQEAIAAYRDAERLLTDSSAPAAELSALGVEETAPERSPEEVCEAHIRNGDRLRDAGDFARAAEAYAAKTGLKMNYQSIGSGGGIAQINAKTVDFGASDMPLKPDELEKNGLTQFPPVIGGEVLVVNLPGVQPGQMTLDGPTIANIYLGKITKWSDPAIAKLNPGMKLPDTPIVVVHRSDGSGTTFIFTNYLSKASPEWKDKVSEGTSVQWPVGLGGKGNEGVAALTSRTAGAIGYVEYAYALQNKMIHTKLVNHDGASLEPGINVFQAAAANADWKSAPGFYLILTDQPGKETWPITGATFILMQKKQDHAERAKEVLNFFDWAYKNGGELAESLDYIPMPPKAVAIFEDSWKQILGPDGKPVWDGHSS